MFIFFPFFSSQSTTLCTSPVALPSFVTLGLRTTFFLEFARRFIEFAREKQRVRAARQRCRHWQSERRVDVEVNHSPYSKKKH